MQREDRANLKTDADRGPAPLFMDFEDNGLLTPLFGEHDRNLALIEKRLEVSITPRGNRLSIEGSSWSQQVAQAVLTDLYARLQQGLDTGSGEVDGAIRMAEATVGRSAEAAEAAAMAEDVIIRTRRRVITPRSPVQADYVRSLRSGELVFGLGPAGTGKTYLAVAVGVSMLLDGLVERIILSRPAVEAGENLGFLPGDLRDKVDPYLRPLFDALNDMLPTDQVMRRIESGEIEVAPVAFMRGRTLTRAFVIVDEAQNTSAVQMKMLLTRLGEDSRMVVTGDLSQIDLPRGKRSGLADAAELLAGVEGVRFVRFTSADVVRHPLVTRIVRAYDERDRRRGETGNTGDTGDKDA
jgi:phosphate starvation-inducible PhoH-like protein